VTIRRERALPSTEELQYRAQVVIDEFKAIRADVAENIRRWEEYLRLLQAKR